MSTKMKSEKQFEQLQWLSENKQSNKMMISACVLTGSLEENREQQSLLFLKALKNPAFSQDSNHLTPYLVKKEEKK